MKVAKKLHENQVRVEQLTKDWTEKWKEAQSIMQVGRVRSFCRYWSARSPEMPCSYRPDMLFPKLSMTGAEDCCRITFYQVAAVVFSIHI